MPIITPDIPPEHVIVNCYQLNTAECILQSSLELYESEFERAYKIMRKVLKGRFQFKDLLTPYECFMTKEGTLQADRGYHFVIVISIFT